MVLPGTLANPGDAARSVIPRASGPFRMSPRASPSFNRPGVARFQRTAFHRSDRQFRSSVDPGSRTNVRYFLPESSGSPIKPTD